MSVTDKQIWDQLNHVVSFIPKQYIDALVVLDQKLEDINVRWVVGGDLAERLRVVQVEVECIEIVSSKEDVERIFQLVQEFKPQPITFQTRLLSRKAVVDGLEYPVYTRSHYFDFDLNTVKIRVHGDLQYRVDDWDWGDVLEFTPEYVSVVGKRIAVTPLSVASELYCNLGWTDRVQKISKVIQKNHPRHNKSN